LTYSKVGTAATGNATLIFRWCQGCELAKMATEVTLISEAEFGRHPFQSNVLSEKFARPGDAGT